jgi:DNA polymerase-3 subunit delta'
VIQFHNIIGQQAAKQGLLKMWHQGHFPHALLLVGAEGTGGLPLSIALAQFIFCGHKQENESCGRCANCHKIAKLEHADLHLSFPTYPPKPGTKAMSFHFINEFREFVKQTPYGTTFDWLQFIDADNKQGNLTAEECREIIDKLNLKSYEGGWKVQIIWRPEYLGKEGNILLKLIEEPPADTIIIMVAENVEDILPTILSRSQIVRLAPVPAVDIAAALEEKTNDSKKAIQIAHIANGSYTEALRLLRHTQNDLFPDVRNWFNALFTNNGPAISKFAEEWSKAGREQQKNFLNYVIRLLEEAIRLRNIPSIKANLPDEEAQFAQKLAGMKVSFNMLQKMVRELSQTVFYIERNAHSKTQLHVLSIRLQYIIRDKELTL